MKKLHIGAILLGGLVVAPFQASTAQTTNVAYGYASERPGYVVFFDKGTSQLSAVASETIRRAASDTDKAAGLVRVVGRADYAAAVKNELVRDGVPARSIVVVPKNGNPLPTIADGISEPANRSVEIKY
ncbi:MAG TPA: hypothetical protein VF949_05995 [Reyranella sp.]